MERARQRFGNGTHRAGKTNAGDQLACNEQSGLSPRRYELKHRRLNSTLSPEFIEALEHAISALEFRIGRIDTQLEDPALEGTRKQALMQERLDQDRNAVSILRKSLPSSPPPG